MNFSFSDKQERQRAEFQKFSELEIVPRADEFDRQEKLPPDVIRKVADRGYLASFLNEEWGGSGFDMLTYGLLAEEIGKACSSVRSLLTVHDMVTIAILRWANAEQRRLWLPALARGELICAFAVTEPFIGSDLSSVQTTATKAADGYLLNGMKKWISFGQIADLFLILAVMDDRSSAFIVQRNSPGLTIRPLTGLLGVRASMLAELQLADCWIPSGNLLGRPGFGLNSVISTALGLGRYSVAWGCVGIAQACLEASVRYARARTQFGKNLCEYQLIQRMVSNMIVNTRAARLLCCRAGFLKNNCDPQELLETLIAKYFASQAAIKAANDAVQVHGANGCGAGYPVQRYLRDAKIMQIIEGSNELQQVLIANQAFQDSESTVQSCPFREMQSIPMQ